MHRRESAGTKMVPERDLRLVPFEDFEVNVIRSQTECNFGPCAGPRQIDGKRKPLLFESTDKLLDVFDADRNMVDACHVVPRILYPRRLV